MNITTTTVALVLRVSRSVFPAIMNRDRWKKGSYISKPSQINVASIKELYKINFNLMTCWRNQFVLSLQLLSLLWAGTMKE
jgi:hypothetical protein